MGQEVKSGGKGRPRIHKDAQTRVAAWRQKQEGRRLDGFVSNSASWRLKKLAELWGCSIAGVVERLALEADEKYQDILFPEIKYLVLSGPKENAKRIRSQKIKAPANHRKRLAPK